MLPSSHEGLPIALLEALSFGLPCLASDIPANREISLPPENYFPVGDVAALARLMQSHCRYPMDESGKEARIRYVRENFDWDARSTFHEVFDELARSVPTATALFASIGTVD